jgi:hypothetical protein
MTPFTGGQTHAQHYTAGQKRSHALPDVWTHMELKEVLTTQKGPRALTLSRHR